MSQHHALVPDRPILEVYRLTWSVLFGAVVSLGVVAAGLVLTPAAVLGLFAAVALPVAAGAWSWSSVSLVPRGIAVSASIWSGIVTVAAHGLTGLVGAWGLAALFALCLTAPLLVEWAIGQLLAQLRRLRPNPPAQPQRPPQAEGVGNLLAHDLRFDDPLVCRLLDPQCAPARRPAFADLTAADLGRIWRVSGTWLSHGFSALEVAHLVLLREASLDEIERRDPSGFRHWVAAEQSWSSEPSPFTTPDDSDLPPD